MRVRAQEYRRSLVSVYTGANFIYADILPDELHRIQRAAELVAAFGAVFGGTAPLIAAAFIGAGQPIYVAVYTIAIVALCLISYLTLPETGGRGPTCIRSSDRPRSRASPCPAILMRVVPSWLSGGPSRAVVRPAESVGPSA